MPRRSKDADAAKSYPVGLAGESNYQGAICVCREGEPVHVCHEIGNPHDEDELVVVSHRGETIGYIPKTNWLRDAIHEQGSGCEATILSIKGEQEPMGVVIEVRLTEDELKTRNYAPAPKNGSKSGTTGCLVAIAVIPLSLALASMD